jgi:hypothetical protein
MILGKRFDLASPELPNSRLSLQKKLVEELSRKSFAELETEKRKIETAISVEIGHLIVVRIEIETKETDLTVVIVHGSLATVGAQSLMHMRPTAVRLSLNAKRIIVSPAWLRACCLTGVHWRHIETGTSENVIAIETETETGTVTVTVTATATGRESVTVTKSESEIAIETATGTGSTYLDRDVMSLLVITIEKGEIVKKSVRGYTVAVLRELRWMSYLMAMSDRHRPDAGEQMRRTIMVAATREIPRLDQTYTKVLPR